MYSPNYPFPYIPKIVCRYFIYGMQDMQHLERVRLSFDKFDIPRGQKGECVFDFAFLAEHGVKLVLQMVGAPTAT